MSYVAHSLCVAIYTTAGTFRIEFLFCKVKLKMENEIASFSYKKDRSYKADILEKGWNLVSECARGGGGEVSVGRTFT